MTLHLLYTQQNSLITNAFTLKIDDLIHCNPSFILVVMDLHQNDYCYIINLKIHYNKQIRSKGYLIVFA